MEQMKRAKEITRQLEDMLVSYKQSCPYTSSWKSEEALIEITSFKSRLEAIKEEVCENEVERYARTCLSLCLNLFMFNLNIYTSKTICIYS